MATHSSILAWRIPWTEESGGLHGVAQLDMTEATQHHAHTWQRKQKQLGSPTSSHLSSTKVSDLPPVYDILTFPPVTGALYHHRKSKQIHYTRRKVGKERNLQLQSLSPNILTVLRGRHSITRLSFRGLAKCSWHFHLMEIAHLIRSEGKSSK